MAHPVSDRARTGQAVRGRDPRRYLDETREPAGPHGSPVRDVMHPPPAALVRHRVVAFVRPLATVRPADVPLIDRRLAVLDVDLLDLERLCGIALRLPEVAPDHLHGFLAG